VQDEYSPLIAAQNHSSLNVTTEDLNFIQPLEAEQLPLPGDSPVEGSAELPVNLHGQHDENATQSETFHEHVTSVDSEVIAQKADEILKSLEMQHEGVSCETAESVTAGADSNGDASVEPESLEESHRVLQEIIDENQRVAAAGGNLDPHRDGGLEPSPTDCVDDQQVESSGDTQASDFADDRDMIVVSSREQNEPGSQKDDDSIPFPATAVSTGRAERMDYQQLFEQLRSISND
jgi:hypothetical protein